MSLPPLSRIDRRSEFLGGVTTFVSVAYIAVVNPAILSFAGIPVGPSTVATILTAAFGSILMGIVANRPFAVAPYMGENAFIAFGLTALGVTWPQRLGTVFLAGLLFLVLALTGSRQWLASAIPASLKHAFGAGIGLFLAFIGLYETGIVTSGATGLPAASLTLPGGLLRAPDVPVKIGDLGQPKVLLALLGFGIIGGLTVRRIKGAIPIGILATATIGMLLGVAQLPKAAFAMPFTGDYSLSPVFLKLDLAGVFTNIHLPVILTLFLMAFFDTTGTLIALGAAGNMLDEKGDLPDMRRPMLVDAATCVFAGLMGTSTSGAYIESAAGIREGARTGWAAILVGILFLLSLFLVPLLATLGTLGFAYGPALIVVGGTMLGGLSKVRLEDPTEALPAFAALAFTVFTFNIGNGLGAALVLYPLLKVAAGRAREVAAGSWGLALLAALYFVFGIAH